LGLDARVATLLCKEITIAKSKEVNTDWSKSKGTDKSNRISEGKLWLKEVMFSHDGDDNDSHDDDYTK
jgi:hypothetical protein